MMAPSQNGGTGGKNADDEENHKMKLATSSATTTTTEDAATATTVATTPTSQSSSAADDVVDGNKKRENDDNTNNNIGSENENGNGNDNSDYLLTENEEVAPFPSSPQPAKKKQKKNEEASTTTKKKKNSKDDFDDMEWICGECHEAECLLEPSADFLLCDGSCKRVFHHPCVGVMNLNTADDDKEWLCKDCAAKRHQCAFCHEYGEDNVDVFNCRKLKCGLYFHESCLAMNNVDVTMMNLTTVTTTTTVASTTVTKSASLTNGHTTMATTGMDDENKNDNNNENENVDEATFNNNTTTATPTATATETTSVSPVPVFTCPAHNCWTCTQKDLLQAEKRKEQEEQASNTTKRKKGRGKKKPKNQSIYQCKSETRVFRCLYCPWAYHASCIPPTSRFHELAVLCPEHSVTHKLPELDLSTSFQGSVEDQIDQQMLKLSGQLRAKKRAKLRNGSNPFFPGMRGDRLESQEKYLLEYLTQKQRQEQPQRQQKINTDENGVDGDGKPMNGSRKGGSYGDGDGDEQPQQQRIIKQCQDLSFCLPCDVKNEVHSKPPSYRFTQTLKYDPNNKPKKIPPSGERCHCVGSCGEDCFNRMVLIECNGDGTKNSNCNVGNENCGNRSLGKRRLAKCKPKREGGRGWGLVTLEDIPKGELVQEYAGEVIDESTKEERLIEWNKEHPNDPNFYIMALTGGWYIDARECANMSRFINHSCDPNCTLLTINVKGYKRNGIYSKRDIAAGEFLSYDYKFDTKQDDRFVCRCGAKNCRGTMKGSNGQGSAKSKPANWKEAKARYDQDKKFMEERRKNCVISQVDQLIPAAEQPDEFVMAGPPEKHRDSAVRNRIFLWRNTDLGADFVSRNSRLEASAGQSGKHREPPTKVKSSISTVSGGEGMDILSILRKNHSEK